LRERVLELLERDIPILKRPYLYLARKAGISERKMIGMVKELRREGMLRHFGPIFDARSLGYSSALVAFRVEGDIDKIAERINSYPGVSHNYLREGTFNLWFTVAVPPDSLLGLEGVVRRLAEESSVSDYLILRAKISFKLGVDLSFKDVLERSQFNGSSFRIHQGNGSKREIPERVKRAVRYSQEPLPLSSFPFREVALKGGFKERELISILKALRKEGILRKFCGIFNHRKRGFSANALVAWSVPEERVIDAGRYLSSFRSVSHCYMREAEGTVRWPFNLYSMVHGQKLSDIARFIDKVKSETGITEYAVFLSRKEFLKRRLKLFTEDFYEWERRKR
jgi:DNA-binding Lrp family transcriptional regulator